jgi:hypothetical protein
MKIELFYRHFLMIPVSHLPVVDGSSNIVGLLSKEKIAREMADLESEGIEYAKIPEHILESNINEKVLQYFTRYRTIPVLNDLGQRIDEWEKPRFLAEASKLLEEKKPVPQETKEDPNNETKNRMMIYRFMELILRSFPDALYATDKDGDTTFYNEKFEVQILSKTIFRDSITIAEKYFRELSRDLISEYFKSVEPGSEDSIDLPCLQVYVKNLELFIRLITLRADEKVIGYLYHFLDPNISWMNQRGQSNFPLIEELFQMNAPLSEVLKEVESSYIIRSFKKNQENISHTASDLKLPRSTLQNRIKFLGLSDILSRDPEVPIPRVKRDGLKQKATEVREKEVLKTSTEPNPETENQPELQQSKIESSNASDTLEQEINSGDEINSKTEPKKVKKTPAKKKVAKKKKATGEKNPKKVAKKKKKL